MIQVTFHLEQGQHYRHWQIKDMTTGETRYANPTTTTLIMSNVRLVNKRGTASRIHSGKQKHRSVCAWLEVLEDDFSINEMVGFPVGQEVSFNPRVKPHWCDESGTDIDGITIDWMCSHGRRLYSA